MGVCIACTTIIVFINRDLLVITIVIVIIILILLMTEIYVSSRKKTFI